MTGKPARQLRTAWTDAWERDDTPDPLPMPLQGIVYSEAARRVTRSQNKELTGFPVGQIVGSMNSVRPVRDVIFDMVEEWVETTQRLDSLIAEGGTALGDAIGTSTDLAREVIDAASAAGGATPSADPNASTVPSASPSTDPSTQPSPSPSASESPADDGEPPLVATVLLSDGSNSTGSLEPDAAAREAASIGMPVYTIALGTDAGMVTVQDEFGMDHTVEVPPDTDTLAAIAETTGARSFQAPSASDLQQIYESLGSRVGTRDEPQEVTQWFAAAGLALMVGGAALAAYWFNRFP